MNGAVRQTIKKPWVEKSTAQNTSHKGLDTSMISRAAGLEKGIATPPPIPSLWYHQESQKIKVCGRVGQTQIFFVNAGEQW